MFNALILEQQDKKTLAKIRKIDESMLPDEGIIVAVDYSSINYKDGLAITGKGRVIKKFPMVPGIDLAGTVLTSNDHRYPVGTKVISTGWGVGESFWGGLAEKVSLKANWLVPLDAGLSTQKAMKVGTAGLTAMLCVQALIDADIKPDDGEILVTGASGGVGATAITLLAQLGYKVVAVTGRVDENSKLLQQLGASRIVARSEFEEPARTLETQLWAGAIDTVGSNMLAKVIAQMNYNGAIAACGLAGGFDLPTTVMPFILRGVKLIGIDSVYCEYDKRVAAWRHLTSLLPESFYQQACTEITLDQVISYAEAITNGQVTGRTVVKL